MGSNPIRGTKTNNMITALWITLGITILLLLAAIAHITKIQKELEGIDREQHTQNMDVLNLMKKHYTHEEILLQHIEILKYLCEKDPLLNGTSKLYMGPVGEA